jgi:phosphoesterase RecJ-like protein
MTTEDQQLAQDIWAAITKSKKVLLCCHVNPDADSVGSNLAFYQALKNLGKEAVVISGDSLLPEDYNSLPGFKDVVLKNFGEVDLTQFDVFISLDSADLGRISQKVAITFPSSLTVINIDHHGSNPKFGQLNLIWPNHSSTCEMLFDLFSLWHIGLTPATAECLFIGMFTDTGGFQYPNATGATLRAAAVVREIAPRIPDLIFDLRNNDEPELLKIEALAFNDVKVTDGVAISLLSHEMLATHKIDPALVRPGYIANRLKAVRGWNVGVCAVEQEPGVFRLSFRTRDAKKFDLAKITASLGGGGHAAAAGATIVGTWPEIKDKMVMAVQAARQV